MKKTLPILSLVALMFTGLGVGDQSPSEATKAYELVRRSYFAFKADEKRQKFRHAWIQVIAAFQGFSKDFPTSSQACRAAYTEAELWRGLHSISRVNDDLRSAFGAYEVAHQACEGSSLADDALWNEVQILQKRAADKVRASRLAERLLQRYPASDMAPRARLWLQEHGVTVAPEKTGDDGPSQALAGRLLGRDDSKQDAKTAIQDIRVWSNEHYARVSIYLSRASQFRVGTIPGDVSLMAKGRIFIDIPNSTTAVKSPILHTPVVPGIRWADKGEGATRIVLDLAQAGVAHNTLILENPFRIVVDVTPQTDAARSSLSFKPSLHKTLVVIDPGHGGKDHGASGKHGVVEKKVALQVSMAMKQVLERAGVSVRLTRDSDTFVPLEERTALANRYSADVFVSIHANAHKDHRVHGVESYYLDTTNDRYALRLAAVENQVREERVSDIQLTMAQMSSRLHTGSSKLLAGKITDKLSAVVKRKIGRTRNLGAKPSLFYVLLGARMPSVLVETSFVSNAQDAQLLGSKAGTLAVGTAIAEAVLSFVRESGSLGQR